MAPAGSMEALIAGVQKGCNAVYLGGERFSARASAHNFSNEELVEAVNYAHFRNVKIYVTVNTLLDDKELEESMDYIGFLYEIGVDALIVQDLGLMGLVREHFPDFPIHASTQMTINSLEGALFLEKLGLERVVLARETPLEEIKLIRENTNLDIEFFAHGALCVSFSGQCLMSSMIGGRSGNRGRCAQPCRRSYEILDEEGKILNVERSYLLSPKDLFTLEDLDRLIDAGVNSLKLEGRMKRPDYVASIVNAYRMAIDGMDITEQKEKLLQAFNRGFTRGLPLGDFGKDFSNTDRPDNKGVSVGRVISKNKLDFSIDLNSGDLLEFETDKGRTTFKLSEDYNKGKNTINLPFNIINGSSIQRILDAKNIENIEEDLKEDKRKAKLSYKFTGKIGEKPVLSGSSMGISVQVEEDFIIEKSKKEGLDRERLESQLSRLGNSPFEMADLEIDMDDGIFLPVSVLNKMRRSLVDELIEKREAQYKRKTPSFNYSKKQGRRRKGKLSYSISVKERGLLHKLDLDKIDRLYLEFIDRDIYNELSKRGIDIYYKTPKILYHEDYDRIRSQLEGLDIKGILINNLGGLEAFRDYPLIADVGLNIFNSKAIEFLQDQGVSKFILSPELSLGQIENILSLTDADIEGIAYGFLEIMTLKHCPFSTIKNCKNDSQCGSCQFAHGYFLRDEKNIDFRTERLFGFTRLYNSYPISMVEHLDRLESLGLDSILLSFTDEDNPAYIVREFDRALAGEKSHLNEMLKKKYENITYGHYFRGVY